MSLSTGLPCTWLGGDRSGCTITNLNFIQFTVSYYRFFEEFLLCLSTSRAWRERIKRLYDERARPSQSPEYAESTVEHRFYHQGVVLDRLKQVRSIWTLVSRQ